MTLTIKHGELARPDRYMNLGKDYIQRGKGKFQVCRHTCGKRTANYRHVREATHAFHTETYNDSTIGLFVTSLNNLKFG